MKPTPPGDAESERTIALAIAAIYHGLSNAGVNPPRVFNPDHVIETAEEFRNFMFGPK